MVDEETGKPVPKEDKGRGYELGKGRYVPIDEEELEAVQIESTHTIDIQGFVPRSEIDKRYLDKPYYIAPGDKAGAEAFVVIRDAMKDQERVALAKNRHGESRAHHHDRAAWQGFARHHLAVRLRGARRERRISPTSRRPRISKDMVELATHILEKQATKFDPSRFKDEYEIALKKLVQRKAKGHTIERPEPAERPSNVIDLMEALRASMKEPKASSTKPKRRRPARKRKAA